MTGGGSQGASVALSRDGRTLAVGSNPTNGRSTIYIWSRLPAGNWASVFFRIFKNVNTYHPTEVALSYNGRTMAARTSTGEIRVWTLSSEGKWIHQLPLIRTTQRLVTMDHRMVLSGDGNTIVLSGSDQITFNGPGGYTPGSILIWKRSLNGTWARQAIPASDISNAEQLRVAVSRDGRTLAARKGPEGIIYIWTCSSTGVWTQMTSQPPIIGNLSKEPYMALSGDGRTIAASSGSKVEIWAYSANGTWVQKGQAYPLLQSPSLSRYASLALSEDGQTLATSIFGFARDILDYVQIMRLSANGTWVSLGPKLVSKPEHPLNEQFGLVMALSGDGLTLAV